MSLSLRKKALSLAIACTSLFMVFADGDGVTSENVVPFVYGDMDNRITREIHELGIIGGNTKWFYELRPSGTIVDSTVFRSMGGSPWVTSNAMAKVTGAVKINTSALPEKQGNRIYARIETRYESVKVSGLVDIEIIAAGSIFSGMVYEPIKGTKNPQAMLQLGVPSSKESKALWSDYKVKAASGKNRVRSTRSSRKSTVAGQDSPTVILLLQKRQENEGGDVHSKRVGMMVQRYTEFIPNWVSDVTYPILYGNITSKPEYKLHMRIQIEEHYTLSGKGKSVSIQGVGRVEPGGAPTHMVLQLTSGHGGAYIGSPGNAFWIDNVELVY